jgi:sialate O-acetylesterase
VKLKGDRLVISFLHAGDGLYLKGDRLESLEILADGQPVSNSKISVSKDTLVVQSESFRSVKSLEILYAWRNFAEVNLYNSAPLPAKPFRRVLSTGR